METSTFERMVANDKRLRAFNDTVPAGILVLGIEDGRVLFANRFFNEALGVDGAAVMGESWASYFVDPADRERLMVRFVEDGEVRNFEVCLQRPDGRQVWGQVSMAGIPIEDEELLLFAFVDITALKEAEAEIRQLANHDPLTELPSPRLLKERVVRAIARAQRENSQFALLFIDLDGFKQVNDGLGHEAGDAVLKRVAAQMLAAVRETDTVARIGGDEFAVVLEKVSDDLARRIGERMIEQISQPQALAQGTACVGASVGIAFHPRHGKDLDALLKVADQAMYRVKSTTKGAIAAAD